jgi:hypothetical protein
MYLSIRLLPLELKPTHYGKIHCRFQLSRGKMIPILDLIQKYNPAVEILPVSHPAFTRFGRLLSGPIEAACAYARAHALPGSGVVYEPAIAGLEADTALMAWLTDAVYGGMPAQLGWCYGRNTHLDGLEYHKGNEVLIAVTDVVLLVGHFDDLQWEPAPAYDSSQVRAFYAPQGSVVEFYSCCLHFAPIQVFAKTGFCTLIALPRGTNTDLETVPPKTGESVLLFARNKWLVVHPAAHALVNSGAYVGIQGENTRIAGVDGD